MPILYPSRSPINPTQLRNILPHRFRRTTLTIVGLIPIIITIIAFEGLTLLGVDLVQLNVVITIILILAAVVFTSSRYGTYSGLISSLVSSVYLAYILSPDPAYPFTYDQGLLRSILLVSALFVGLAAVTGYLREQIQQSFLQEQIARALAEEQQYRLEAILDNMPIGVVITDANTNSIIYTNNLGQTLLSGDLTRSDNQHIQKFVKSIRKQPKQWEFSYAKPDGQSVHLQTSTSPVNDLSGEHVANVYTFFDVSQQKEVEQRKDDFIRIASHELKTPVTSLKIYMQLFQRHRIVAESPDLKDIADKANDQINKLSRLMADLLDVSHIQTGQSEYNIRQINLNSLIREIAKNIQPSTHHQISVEGKISGKVDADAEKITQVFTNLLANAIKYSAEADQINVRITQSKTHASIAIQDFGIGIAKAQQRKIFEHFYQVKQKDGHSYPGMGIGLYICQRIIQDHHGTLVVESELGKGSTFTFTLPLHAPNLSTKSATPINPL